MTGKAVLGKGEAGVVSSGKSDEGREIVLRCALHVL